VVGSSRYARTLREAISKASQDPSRRPVLISGEPGLEKDNLAALVHFGSPDRQQLMLRFDGALLRPDGSELFGNGAGLVASPESSERPLLELLGAGALLIDKLDQVAAPLQARLLELARTGQWPTVEAITGRDYEHLISRTGRRISLTAINMHDDLFEGLLAVQFHQHQPGEAELHLLPGPTWSADRQNAIHAGLMRKLGDDFNLTLRVAEQLELTSAGKHRWLVTSLK
jgi:transcriptional regulator with AAA-type ATPase domain